MLSWLIIPESPRGRPLPTATCKLCSCASPRHPHPLLCTDVFWQGIDVAWSKIEADPNNLSHDQMRNIVDEISYGLGLDHPHVIKVSNPRQLGPGGSGDRQLPQPQQLLFICARDASAVA